MSWLQKVVIINKFQTTCFGRQAAIIKFIQS